MLAAVVASESAHIDAVEAKRVMRSSCSTQSEPETIQEVHRILLEHAKAAAVGPND